MKPALTGDVPAVLAPTPATEAIRAWIGDHRILLFLDSCEYLLAKCRDLAGDLLTTRPAVRILATSREPLRVPGETVVEVETLPSPRGRRQAGRSGQWAPPGPGEASADESLGPIV